MGELTHLLRSKAVLMPGVSVSLINEKTRDTQTWQYKGGLRDYLTQTLTADPVIPLFEGEGFADSGNESFAEGRRRRLGRGLHRRRRAGARELRQPDPHQRRRYARQRPARRPVQRRQELHRAAQPGPKGVKLLPEDVFARASYVLSAKVLDPQFQGQIKERLNSRDAVRLVSRFCAPGAGSCG